MGNCLDIFIFYFFFTAEETLHLCITLMSAFKALCVTIRVIKKMQIPAFISSLRAACVVRLETCRGSQLNGVRCDLLEDISSGM